MEIGKVYSFGIKSIIDISGEEFFILIDPEDKKHLLPLVYYSHYNFRPEQIISCKVDKINCTGKIFLEPINPFYSVGETYNFTFVEEKQVRNSYNEIERRFVVSDNFGNTHWLWMPANANTCDKGDRLQLVVAQIRKGNILLFHPSINFADRKNTQGKQYQFKIEGIATLLEGKEFYRLQDETGQLHFLRKKYYVDYAFAKGNFIKGTIVSPPYFGSYYIEPEYPGYCIGQVYSFRFLREEDYYHPSGKKETTWIVLDENNKECHLFLPNTNEIEIRDSAIKAKVEYVFKGKLFLRMKI
ncbi:MAG: hypothetical protein U9R19_10325 [Bacteroidota bacterium]|nr:hypothetical protein [Bacteroidota bacterium]